MATVRLRLGDLSRGWLRAARRSPRATIGLAILGTVTTAAILAPLIAPYGQSQMEMSDAFQPPTLRHIFGTDTFGRDIFSLTLYGGRPAIAIAFATVGLSVVLGVPIGIVAGYVGGAIDSCLMGLTELSLALPAIVLAIVIIAFLGTGLQNVVLALALVNAPLLARVARGSTLSMRNRLFVDAARAIGDTDRAIMLRQVAPNIATPILVQASLSFAYVLLAEASLSFLGLGASPAAPSWGRMLTDAIPFVGVAPWMGLFPGFFIVIAVVSLMLIGDGLSDLLDPTLKSSAAVA